MAWRWDTGRCPSSEDALHIAVRIGSRSSMHSSRLLLSEWDRGCLTSTANALWLPDPHLPYTAENLKVTWRRRTVSLAADDHRCRYEPTRPSRRRTWEIHQLLEPKEVECSDSHHDAGSWPSIFTLWMACGSHSTVDSTSSCSSLGSRRAPGVLPLFKPLDLEHSWYNGSISLVAYSFVG